MEASKDEMRHAAMLVVNFCRKAGFDVCGICAVTIQENHGSRHGSFIVDLRDQACPLLEASYVSELPSHHQHQYIQNFSVSVCSNLDASALGKRKKEKFLPTQHGGEAEDCWCCDPCNWSAKSQKRTNHDSDIAKFLESRGSSSFVFKVRKQINYGPDVWAKNFTLTKGIVQETTTEATHKVHSFKNYVCMRHKMYYEI
eukprot:CAMPEP_0172465672 /NCGR_PEP_ID=MMETSP1065-20121228/54220_1 /TAXON_ID=265537 /ORGANISM="Amphiprora paludosa, Strain CCMP125" /LENGTH=198 /DNA_ID=CAMNT_0013222277 /DNA_START=151 /DNA_END=744 /DNA_ORIENTATION=-